jgi:hypothetical protein
MKEGLIPFIGNVRTAVKGAELIAPLEQTMPRAGIKRDQYDGDNGI